MSFAIAGTVLAVGGAAYGANRAGAAADAQVGAANDANALQREQFNTTRADLASGRSLYDGANNALAQLQGFATPGSQGTFDTAAYLRDNPDVAADPWASQNAQEHYNRWGRAEGRASPYVGATAPTAGGAPNLSSFYTSPDYNFRRTEGQRGIENSFAARGGAASGNALRALTEFNSQLASGEFGNYFNRLSTMAGLGSSATNTGINAGQNYANASGNLMAASGDARASGIQNQFGAIGNGVNQISGLWGDYFQNKRQNNALFNSLAQPYEITGAASRRM